MDALWQDLRFTARSFRRQPGFTLVAVLTMALGISATTVIFSAVDALILKPLPVAAPERLVTVDEVRNGTVHTNFGIPSFSFDRYEAYRDASARAFSGLAAHRYSEGSLRTVESIALMRSSAIDPAALLTFPQCWRPPEPT